MTTVERAKEFLTDTIEGVRSGKCTREQGLHAADVILRHHKLFEEQPPAENEPPSMDRPPMHLNSADKPAKNSGFAIG